MKINTHQHSLSFPVAHFPDSDEVITQGEFFAGGGGWTEGTEEVEGVKTIWILNHDATAIRTNSYHHKNVKVYWADVYVQDEHELERVDHIHGSIECTQHSKANCGQDKKIGSYTMGWELVRYIEYLLPNSISIENVREFKKWSPTDKFGKPDKKRTGEEFERWKKTICDLGYEYTESIRDSADDGLPTRRTRYFAIFHRPGMQISWPEPTHNKKGTNGKKKHIACRHYLDLKDEGYSIFGRKFNAELPKQHRKPLSKNSLDRIAAGIKKYASESCFIAHYYGTIASETRAQSIENPLATITTANRHQLIRIEKLKFITDHCQIDYADSIDLPLRTQTTRQTKQKITVDYFLTQYYGCINTQDVDSPLKTITTKDRHQLIRVEKLQFITTYFNSNGNPGANIHSVDEPLSTITADSLKHQLVTLLDNFDIKARFLRPDELAGCSTFPRDYFTQPGLKLSNKNAVKMIGNAVPPMWATVLMRHNVEAMLHYKKSLQKQAV